MGFWKGTGKLGLSALRGVGGLSMGVGKAGLMGAEKIGSPITKNALKAPGMFATAIGVGAAAGAIGADVAGEKPSDGAMALGTGAFAAASIGGASAVAGLGATAVGMAGLATGAAGKIGGSLIKMPEKAIGIGNLNEIKMKPVGLLAMAAVGVVGGALSAEKKFEQSRMGTNDGMLRTATPILPMPEANTYSNPGAYTTQSSGATGDLVFAMHNNR